MTDLELHLIVAMTRQRVIGKRGGLPWKLKGDLPRLKNITMGQTLIMGRATFDSIGRPLPGRNNIVLDREKRKIKGAIVCESLEEALATAKNLGVKTFVFGGASVYEQLLPKVSRMLVSHVKQDYQGDVYFPKIDWNEWREVEQEDYEEFTAKTYERVT